VSTHKQRLLAGESYLADDPELLADRYRCRLVTERLNATRVSDGARGRTSCASCSGDSARRPRSCPLFRCDYGYQIQIGSRSFINFGAVILDSAPVRIGNDVQIGPVSARAAL
jgi:maltose O-acetyltransferase